MSEMLFQRRFRCVVLTAVIHLFLFCFICGCIFAMQVLYLFCHLGIIQMDICVARRKPGVLLSPMEKKKEKS